jgi:hypothetical protein
LWNDDAPAPGVPADDFSVRWTKSEYLAAGRYKFTTVTDDGVRLFIDGRSVIDEWHNQSSTVHETTVDLDSGSHTIRMEYFDSGWTAQAKLSWDTTPDQPSLYRAEYWNTPGTGASPPMPTRPADVVRDEVAVAHDWALTSPDPAISVDHFVARWTRSMTVASGDYVFSVTADDGVRVLVDGVPLIDKWMDHSAATWNATTVLAAGQHTVAMEYYEDTWDAVAKLSIHAA